MKMTSPAGPWVPLITPLRGGAVDFQSLARLCHHLLEQGVVGFVPCGSTGEAASLHAEERAAVIATVRAVAGKMVMAGSVSTSTAATIDEVQAAAEAGAEAALVLTPTLVGATQPEMHEHYRVVADASPVPILIYNYPERTGGGMSSSTTLGLARHPNIVGTKQSVDSLDAALNEILAEAPSDFSVLTGSPGLTWPALAMGADGAVLAAAHLLASDFVSLLNEAKHGDFSGAMERHRVIRRQLPSVEGVARIKTLLCDHGVIASAEVRPPLLAVV